MPVAYSMNKPGFYAFICVRFFVSDAKIDKIRQTEESGR